MRIKLAATIIAFTLAAVGFASPVQAFGEQNADVTVSPIAYVNKSGKQVAWRVTFICPKKALYTLNAGVSALQAWPIEYVNARKMYVTGKCTGKWQSLNLQLKTVSSYDYTTESYVWVPLRPTRTSQAQVTLSGNGFFAGWASGPDNCCEDDGARIIIASV